MLKVECFDNGTRITYGLTETVDYNYERNRWYGVPIRRNVNHEMSLPAKIKVDRIKRLDHRNAHMIYTVYEGRMMKWLLSYHTPVAVSFGGDIFTTNQQWGVTTSHHINRSGLRGEDIDQSALTDLFYGDCTIDQFYAQRYRWGVLVGLYGYLPNTSIGLFESEDMAISAAIEEKNAYRDAGYTVHGRQGFYDILQNGYSWQYIEIVKIFYPDWMGWDDIP